MNKTLQVCKICIMYDGTNNPYVGDCLCNKGNGWPNDSCEYWQPAANGWDGALSVYHTQARVLIVSAQDDKAWDEAWLVKLLELSRICKRKLRPKYSERRKTR